MYLSAIDAIVLGEDPRQGFVQRNVFYHPELRFRFPVPQGFRLINQPAQVIMIEDQRRAIIGFRSTGERSAESAASEFLRQPGLRVLETFKSRSDDLPAFGAIADAQSQTGQIVRMLVYFIEHRGHVYEFIAYSAPQSFGHFQNEFLRVMRGFGEVNDRDIWRREPVRLDVERASRSAPFGSFIPAELPNDMRPEELAILNQVALEEQIERGKLLKLPSRR